MRNSAKTICPWSERPVVRRHLRCSVVFGRRLSRGTRQVALGGPWANQAMMALPGKAHQILTLRRHILRVTARQLIRPQTVIC